MKKKKKLMCITNRKNKKIEKAYNSSKQSCCFKTSVK